MKIWQVVPYYPPHLGGMEFYVQRLSEELVKKGFEVTVFTSSNSIYPSKKKINGVEVFFLKQTSKIYNVPIVPSIFWKLFKEKKPEIIHAHQYPVFFSDFSSAVSWLKKIPFLLQVHVVSEPQSLLSGFVSNAYYTTLGKWTIHNAKRVIVPSQAYKFKLINMSVKPSKIQVIPPCIETNQFSRKNGQAFKVNYNLENSKIILSVGRLNYQKGFENLLKVMPLILKQIPNARLIIVGQGERFLYLNQLAKKLEIERKVIFTGALKFKELINAYEAADVFVLPSLFESFGIALIEAQASAKPVIGSRIEGICEAVIDGETGILFEPNNLEQLKDAIVRILTDRSLAQTMGSKGKEFVIGKFDTKNIVNQVVQSYYQVLGLY